jgi:hypothetical protein
MATNGSVALPPAYDSIAGEGNTPTSDDGIDDEPLPQYHPPVLPFQRLSGLLLPLFLLPLSLLLLFTLAPASAMSSMGNFFKVGSSDNLQLQVGTIF